MEGEGGEGGVNDQSNVGIEPIVSITPSESARAVEYELTTLETMKD